MAYEPTCLCTSVVYVPSCLRLNVPKACQLLIFTCQRANKLAISHANFSTWPANLPKSGPIFQTLLLRNAIGNFYTLLLYKKFYIILDIMLLRMCICIAHKNCIILPFCTSWHLKDKCAEFLLSETFFSLVRNENNIKEPGFYTLQVTRVFSNCPLKQLKQNKEYVWILWTSWIVICLNWRCEIVI